MIKLIINRIITCIPVKNKLSLVLLSDFLLFLRSAKISVFDGCLFLFRVFTSSSVFTVITSCVQFFPSLEKYLALTNIFQLTFDGAQTLDHFESFLAERSLSVSPAARQLAFSLRQPLFASLQERFWPFLL